MTEALTAPVARDPSATLMHAEAAESGAAVARMLAANRDVLTRVDARLRDAPPAVVVTCARGSSDHAATYAKHLIETLTGTPTASFSPSVASLYHAPVRPGDALCLAISQSGRSPDLLAAVEAQRRAGAFVVALVNDISSPLAEAAYEVVALSAGPERSVAATKSFVTALAAIAALVAAWSRDTTLASALESLPEALDDAFALDWTAAEAVLRDAANLFVIGRGVGLGVAQEMALKLKETAGLHAEALSAAEVKHGPMAIVGKGFPVLALAGSDAAGDDVRETARLFRERGADVVLASTTAPTTVPVAAGHPSLEPLLAVASFYRMAASLSVARGFDPDRPPYLAKVTRTR